MKLTELSQSDVAVWGYGVEAKATLAYLNRHSPDLKVTVLCPSSEADGRQTFNHQTVDAALLSQFDVVIKSPGISPYQVAVVQTTARVISPSALWFDNERERVGAQVIAVTGTKGKSTTAALMQHVLTQMGHQAVLVGNFGVPLIEVVDRCDYIVLETSSYQAQDGAIRADWAVLLNLYEEHLDWHGDVARYHLDKWRLLEQAQNTVINARDDNSHAILQRQPLQVPPKEFNQNQGFYQLNNTLMYQDKALLSVHGWRLKGAHNLSNAAAVCATLTAMGLPIRAVVNALKSFQPLPHRLQSLGLFNGVEAINDSISSTPLSTLAALATVDVSKTWLLLGGYDRGLDWSGFAKKMSTQPAKGILCSGQNGERIRAHLADFGVKSTVYETLKQAVEAACQMAEQGDVVLLSPGAPSFDAFANYQQRGVQFESWINAHL